MTQVRVLVGTRKGAFVLTADGKREKWEVSGPHFAGWEIYHVKGSPVDPNRLYASQSSGWFGQMIQRSNDGGKTWEPVGNKFAYDGVPGTHQWYDGTPHPWEFKRVWHLEPSLTDPDTVYAGVEDAALVPLDRRRTDRGTSCRACAATARAASGSPAPAACACTRSCSTRANPKRMFIAISAAGAFRTDDGGKTWQPINRGLHSAAHPRPDGRGRPLRPPHRHAPVAARRAVHAKALGRDAQRRRAAIQWHEVSGNLPTDFGFPIDVHAHEPETIYVVPIKSDSEHYPPEGKLRVYRSRTGGNEWEALTNGLPQSDCYVNVLRDAMAVDSLDPCGVYFGTTGGQVYASAERGRQLGCRSCAICRRCCRSRCRRCHDSRGAAGAFADAGAGPRRGAARSRADPSRSARCSTRWKPAIRCCAARSATTSRTQRRPFLRFFACEQDLSHESPDAPLPDAVATGAEPFLIIGALAGG